MQNSTSIKETQLTKVSETSKESEIMVALDFPTVNEALHLVEKLEGFNPFLKIGMQLFYLGGPALIDQLKQRGFSIFLDLKLHDIPNTVKGAAQSLTSLEVDIFTIHCAGGQKMMEAALEGIDKGLASGQHHIPKVVGITQLTSTSQETMNQEMGIPGTIENSILNYADLATKSGLNGVVCSPLEVRMIKETCGEGFITVTPGIRPLDSLINDQVRVTTPKEAARLGSDYLVIGRAITQAEDPVVAYETILNEIQGVR
jgi:orotidine-5'-phosphate decarboxylase